METPETKPLSEAASYEDFKSQRAANRDAAAGPAEKTPQSEEDKPAPSAAEAGTAETVSQDDKPKSVDDQIKELRAKGKHAAANKLMADESARPHREEAERLRKELEGLRTRPAEAKTEPAKTEAAPATDPSDPEPKPEDPKYAGAQGYEKYLRDCARWDYRQEARTQGAAAGKRAAVDALLAKIATAKAKYADFDAVTAADLKAQTGLILTPPMQQFIRESDAGMDVLYQLGKDPAEYKRITALSPTMQLAELGYLGKLIVTPPANQPEKKTPAVTKVTAPPRVLSGTDTPPAKALSEASSYEEFKQLRRKRTA